MEPSNALESWLAAALASRDVYETIRTHEVKALLNGRAELAAIWRATDKWYQRDTAVACVDRGMLEAVVHESMSGSKQADAAVTILRQLPTDVSSINALECLRASQRERMRLEMADALLSGDEDELDELLASYMLLKGEQSQESHTSTIGDALLSQLEVTNKFPIYPAALNRALGGGAWPGHTLLLFGRPGIGKTLLCINIVAGLLYHGHTGLYIGNEEPVLALMMRALSRLGDETLDRLYHNTHEIKQAAVAAAIAKARDRGTDRLHWAYGVIDWGTVEALIKQHKPSFVVIDQIRHMRGSGGRDEGLTQALEASSRMLREMAARYGMLGIGVTQAGPSAEGKAVLGLTDVESSKTGVQGAFDAVIGIGASAEMLTQNTRMLSVCRNKISGKLSYFPVTAIEQHTKLVAP